MVNLSNAGSFKIDLVPAADARIGVVPTVNVVSARFTLGNLRLRGAIVVRECAHVRSLGGVAANGTHPRAVNLENKHRFKVSLMIFLMRCNETLKDATFKVVQDVLAFTHNIILSLCV
jgi:hypothetical protein